VSDVQKKSALSAPFRVRAFSRRRLSFADFRRADS
jgi:hypothetical protein